MEPLWLHVGVVALLVGTQAVFTGLAVRNVTYAEQLLDREREWVETTLEIEDIETLRGYHRLTTAFSELKSWIGLLALLGVLYSGGLSWVVELLAATGQSVIVQGVLFFVGSAVVIQLFSLPFSLVSTFGIDSVYEFNQQSPRLFFRDWLLSLGISVLFVAVLTAAVMAAVTWLPVWWPAVAWLLFVGFSLSMQILYPRVIAPLFNEFKPVDGGELREAVESVFDRAGFSTDDIYTMDASKRSSRLNAYFIGFGRTKRVVLFDTLVEKLSLPALQSVLAHELAHWKEAHIWKQFAASAAQMAVVFALLGVLVAFEPLYAAFGIPPTATYAGLLLAVLLVGPVLQFTAPVSNKLSLRHEREADAFAASVTSSEAMIDALGRLAGENLANPFPHPWYAAFHHSHPPIPERIRLLQQHSAEETPTDEHSSAAD